MSGEGLQDHWPSGLDLSQSSVKQIIEAMSPVTHTISFGRRLPLYGVRAGMRILANYDGIS